MPTLTKKLSDFSVKSEIGQNWVSSTGTVTKSFSMADIPKGSTINSATLTGKVQSQMFGGTYKADNDSSVTLYTHTAASNAEKDIGSKNVKAWLTALNGTYGSLLVDFSYKLNPNYVPSTELNTGSLGQDVPAYSQEYGYFRGITLTVNYTLPYSAVTAPTTVKLSVQNPKRGQKTTLSWSGAKNGTNNAITGYEVYRSTSKTGTYTKIASVGKSVTSYAVTAPSGSDVTWYFKIKALGTVSGYDSGLSSAIATMAMTTTACTAPTSVTVSTQAPCPHQAVTISWSGAKNGTNNPITGYRVYQAASSGGTYKQIASIDRTATSGSTTVNAPESGSLYFKVVTVGEFISSSQSAAAGSFTVDRSGTSDFTLPDEITIGEAFEVQIGEPVAAQHSLQLQIIHASDAGTFSLTFTQAGGTLTATLERADALPQLTHAAQYTADAVLSTAGAGYLTKRITVLVPEDVVPVVTGAAAAPVSDSVPSAWSAYVAGHSQARITLNTAAQTAYGAAITKYKITGNGASAAATALPITADSALLEAGERTFTITATDTRGRSGSQQITVTVEPYAAPALKNIVSRRTDSTGQEEDEGTYILAEASAVIASCGGRNTAAVQVYYKKESVSAYTSAGNLQNGQLLFGNSQITLRDNYNVRYIVTDALGESRTYNDIVTRSVWEMHVKRGGGAWAFGGVADTPGALHVYGGVKADDEIKSTRNGIGFSAEGASGAVGFSATNTTSGQGVSVLVGTGGTNRGLYDNTSDKWMAYCDGNDALRFAGVTSATKGDLGIGDLEDSIGSMKTFAKTLSANSPTTFTFSGFCGVAILIEGANTSLMCILLVHCSGAGNITVSKIGTAANITTSTGTNRLTITNGASSTAAYARVIRITASGTMPT